MKRPAKPRQDVEAKYLLRRLYELEKQTLDAYRMLDDLSCTVERVREFLLSVEGGAR